MRISWISVVVLVAMFGGMALAVAQERPAPPKLPEGVKFLPDLQYVEGGHERNCLDLYLPEKAEGRLPLVVWIHGGAWRGGSKEGCPAVSFTAKGYAVASINSKDASPFLIVHGDKDNIVPLEQSELLAKALTKAGVEVTLQVVEGNGHGGPGFFSTESQKLMGEFFAKHLGKEKK